MVKFFEFLFSIYIDFILNLHNIKYSKSIIYKNNYFSILKLHKFYFEIT